MQVNSDFRDLVSALSAAGARFLIVSAYAVMHHSEPRYTKDLDIWVEPTRANAKRVMTALERFGAPMARISAKDFFTPEMVFQIGVAPIRIDLLTSVAGLAFATAYKNAVGARYSDVDVKVLSLDDTIAAKRAAGRPQDLLDLERLDEARTESTPANVVLPGEPSRPGYFVVATVSWARGSAGAIGAATFTRALEHIQRRCDLVLCAGMSVEDHPMADEILRASDGSPVVFERDDGGYCVVYERQGTAVRKLLRDGQRLKTGAELRRQHKGNNPVAQSFADGSGLIYLPSQDLWLALFICGENNAIQSAGSSVFRDKPAGITPPAAFEQRWVMLNPAHARYGSGIRSGVTKVDRPEQGPVLGNIVRAGRRHRDGTVAPAAVIHCNNFPDGETKRGVSRARASMVFWGDLDRPSKHEAGNVDTRVVIYDLPLARLHRDRD